MHTNSRMVCDPSTCEQIARFVRPLLDQLLGHAAAYQKMPLRFDVDSAGVAMVAWSAFSAGLSSAERIAISDGAVLCAALDLIIEQALDDASCEVGRDRHAAMDAGRLHGGAASVRGQPVDAKPEGPLAHAAKWFDRLCQSLRLVHFRAIEIIRLRVEGYGVRDVALQTDMGVYLVHRILADVRRAWIQQPHEVERC